MSNIPNRPPKVSLRGVKKFLTAFEQPRSDNRRFFVALVAISSVALLEGFAIAAMAPMKERIPYFVEVEQATGRVEFSERAAKKFVPDERVRQFFLARWLEDFVSIDDMSRTHRLPRSYSFVRGMALKQWDRTYADIGPLKILADTPEFRREVKISSYVPIADDTIQIRFLQRDMPSGKELRRIATIKVANIPPENEQQIYANPAGLWITEFQINDEQI